jgi:hypothetical protein
MFRVSSTLHRELTKIIKGSSEVDLYDMRSILEYAQKHGYATAFSAIQADPWWYLRCINEQVRVSD